ncbi:MAG: hypothetical protein LAT81_05080 [Oceanicaulis sp.]|nr:hypothetical protein [Oceanicaulis sp.]
MTTSFTDRSTDIANKFIQSVLFVDDEIYSDKDDKTHNLDARELVRAFSKSQKLCALNNPISEDDFDDIIQIAKKTDISVLDWKMDLEKSDDGGNEETDVDEDDPRGAFTLKLIEELLTDKESSGSFRLVLIYTGEVILNEIVDKVHSHFESQGLKRLSDNSVGKLNIKIIIAGKPKLKGRLTHAKQLEKWIIEYSDLPKFLLFEFAKMTEGLISNFALECLSTIRSNNFRILQLFNKNLDTAYLGHKVLLTSINDAEDLLVDLMRDSLGDLLQYSEMNKMLDSDTIKLWLSENIVGKKKVFLNKKALPFKDNQGVDLKLNYVITDNFIEKLVFGEEVDVSERFKKVFKNIEGFKSLDKSQKAEFINTIQVNSSSLFTVDQNDHEKLDLKFANLTHHNHLFKPNKYPPKLTLGVVLRGMVNTDKYWVCIQQKCDSVRLKKGEIRKFLFLPLKVEKKGSSNGFHFTDPNGQRLRLIIKTHGIRTIKFQDNDGEGVIKAELQDSKYIFKQYYSEEHEDHKPNVDENFEWVFDLKDLHAQRISNDIAREISRVGLEESEWLRRWAK